MSYNYVPQLGDVFLCDSDKFGAKMVKFFMQSANVYQQIWRFMFNRLDEVRFYHAGIVINDAQIIEQQSKVQYGETKKIYSRKIIIYRKKSLTDEQRALIWQRAVNDLGKGYGIVLVIAKFLTWLTGITLFINVFGALDREHEICINRVCKWYNHICDFGSNKYFVDNTKTVDEYCQLHPEEWEIVYSKGV